MKTVGITNFRKQIHRYIDEVEGGEELLLIRNSQPIARLVPMTNSEPKPEPTPRPATGVRRYDSADRSALEELVARLDALGTLEAPLYDFYAIESRYLTMAEEFLVKVNGEGAITAFGAFSIGSLPGQAEVTRLYTADEHDRDDLLGYLEQSAKQQGYETLVLLTGEIVSVGVHEVVVGKATSTA